MSQQWWRRNRRNAVVCVMVLTLYALLGGSVQQWFYQNYGFKLGPTPVAGRRTMVLFLIEEAVWLMGVAAAMAALLVRREQYWRWMFAFGWLLITVQTVVHARTVSGWTLQLVADGLVVWSIFGWPLIGSASLAAIVLRLGAVGIGGRLHSLAQRNGDGFLKWTRRATDV